MDTLVGEFKTNSGSISIQGTISYLNQHHILFLGTIRENVTMNNKSYDEKKYQNVIKACCLDRDFINFPNGDQETLGDNGFNLSEGQKARICLAREIYSDSILFNLK